MKLLTLILSNFKGIRDFTLDAAGEPVDIFGDNATGKTTLSDALHWLLFDKDSSGRKDFDIKTLDSDNRPVHNLEHAVEAVLLTEDGARVALRKVYHEVWTKKRGAPLAEFTGHTTEHFIDGVPVPLKEYKARIASLADEDLFRLLTNPAHFNSLHWQERRRILLDVCGNVADAEVIATDAKLARLTEVLGSRTLEDQRKVLAARRREINDELERIPVRISEVERGLPAVPDAATLPAMTPEQIADAVTERREAVARIDAGGEVAEQVKRKREVEAEIIALANAELDAANTRSAVADQERSKLRAAVTVAKDALAALTADRDRAQRTRDANTAEVARLDERMAALREQWKAVNAEAFTDGTPDTCAACGQALPADKVSAAREAATAAFNRDKAQRLERIDADGKALKAQADALTAKDDLTREIARLDGEILAAEKNLADAEATAAAPAPEQPEPVDDPKRAALIAQVDEIDATIAKLSADAAPRRQELVAEIAALEADAATHAAAEKARADITKGRARMDELACDEKRLADEFEQIEADLFLTEEFIRAKVAMLEDRINARFHLVRFKLFDQLVNGGIEECCETLVGGVPYSTGLNNAARIAAGLDIIATLSAHYGVSAPVFLDNAEAITGIPALPAQLIALYVSEPDKNLRVVKRATLKEAC
jgi:chromosome segregation ATPase